MSKVLLLGSPEGNIQQAFAKAAIIQTKQAFDVCIVTGDLFNGQNEDQVDALLRGDIKVPITTYMTLGKHALPSTIVEKVQRDHGEICENLFLLGRAGSLTTAEGLKMTFLGGAYDVDAYNATVEGADEYSPYFTHADVEKLCSASKPDCDILITYEWPESVRQFSKQDLARDVKGVPPVAQLATAVRPRYHFVGSQGNLFYEREPYRNIKRADEEADPHVARFISLGNVGNPEKIKWFYGFNIVPNQTPQPEPATTTAYPYTEVNTKKRGLETVTTGSNGFFWSPDESEPKRARREEDGAKREPPESYVCARCSIKGHWIRDCDTLPENYVCKICKQTGHLNKNCPERDESAPKKPRRGYKCKICGSGDHYIGDCPEKGKLSADRGPRINPDSCFFCLSNPRIEKHLIVSIGIETYVALAKGPLMTSKTNAKLEVPAHALIIPIAHQATLVHSPDTIAEMGKYREAIKAMYAEHDCVPVTFEVSRSSGVHAHWQIIPIPKEKADEVGPKFMELAERESYELSERALQEGEENFFRVMLPNDTELVHAINKRFDLQFGRRVIGELLGISERAEWKACVQSEEEEKEDAQGFKKLFASYDFTLQ
ncbi:hypothetical protein SAICODRAFT_10313 [Saitoella complicata NRRL Y-17804]|uniref:CCHC-type domain-containing protein n=1 Tax=Saitoella complicata (strain BCRC 22490 / CBS 7301 / JCM 7358 / NBRC 10748 / NRRL Y-17804) TaxID=698492 RepID=A0A0E9NIL4_SAICN|nr:uncharacterized protein SAICODRAFT_10313 [Saitoella complicata NRRL Y-17804]ODQ50020.1 hypothetical protein SAICODRAFT_10313 [Saitoella complicata NRRL Y-17804]GAO49712.1 hypothetical protein G7K_3856-t1 [Saitoella complicata NRRL Y-17804]